MFETSRNRFAHNAAMQYGLQIAKYLFPFVTIPYLTRTLGPEAYAIRAYILAAMTFAQVFLDYGFNAYGTKAIALAENDWVRKNEETSSIVILRCTMFLLGLPVLAVITALVPIMRGNPIYVTIAYFTVCFKAMLPDFVFQGEEDMGIITQRFVISQAVGTALILLLVHGPADLLWVPTFEALAALIALVWSWHNVLGLRGYCLVLVPIANLRNAFAQSTVFFFSSAATTIFTSLTTLMIGIYVTDTSQISYWSIAMTAVSAIQSLYTPITNSLYPHMVIRRDFALAKRLLMLGMPTVLIGTVAFAMLRDTVMLVIGGTEYLEGSYVIGLVSPVLFFSFPAMLLGFPILAAVGRESELTASSIVSAGFHIAGLVVLALTGQFTIPHVAILRDCTEAVLLAARAWFVWRYLVCVRNVARADG